MLKACVIQCLDVKDCPPCPARSIAPRTGGKNGKTSLTARAIPCTSRTAAPATPAAAPTFLGREDAQERRESTQQGHVMTLKARVIPCLDVKDGRVVEAVSFVVELMQQCSWKLGQWCRTGADELTFLDITASSDNRGIIFMLSPKVTTLLHATDGACGGVRKMLTFATCSMPAPTRSRSTRQR